MTRKKHTPCTTHWLIILLMIVGAVLCVSAFTDETKYPIDTWLEKALARDSSTAGTRQAANKAREMWDADMNKTYRRLMRSLKPNHRAALQKSQKTWLVFRKAESAALGTIIASQQGTMWPMVADERLMRLVRERALHLRGYDSDLNEKR